MAAYSPPNASAESPLGENDWAADVEGVQIERVKDEETPDGKWVLRVETALEGWEGIGGVRSGSFDVETGEVEMVMLARFGPHRTITPALSERDAEDKQIEFHEDEEDAVVGQGNKWVEIPVKATFTEGTKARLFLRIDGPAEEPDEPIFYLDRKPEVWPAPFPKLRFKDDFETGDFSRWTEVQEIGDTATWEIVEGDEALVGSYSAKATIGPDDERSELRKESERTILTEGFEGFIKWRSRLFGNPGGVGVMMQCHNSGDVLTPPINLGHHTGFGRIVFDCGPTDGVAHTIDWFGPRMEDIMGVWTEYIVGFKISQDPKVGYIQIWRDRIPQRLTDDWFKDQPHNRGGYKIFRETLHEVDEGTPHLYLKLGTYDAGGPTGRGGQIIDSVVLSEDPADIFTPIPRYTLTEEGWQRLTRTRKTEEGWVPA